MKYFIFIFLFFLTGCSVHQKNTDGQDMGNNESAWIVLEEKSTIQEEITNKKLLSFVPNYPVVSGDIFDPDGDGKIPGLLLTIKRYDLGIEFQYIYDLSKYYYNTGISLQEYVDNLDLKEVSKKLFDVNKGGIQLLTGDRKSYVYTGCILQPDSNKFFDYDNKISIYKPIQILIHREGYGSDEREYKKCEDKDAELYINRELWALNQNFAIRLPQCGIGCAPGPDFRRAATIRPILN